MGAQSLPASVRSFVLRQGRMTTAQKRAMVDLWPVYGVQSSSLHSLSSLFTNTALVIVEIGFGMGQGLAQMALDHPQLNFLGIEVHAPGIGRLMQQLAEHDCHNVKIIHGDAVSALSQHMPSGVLAGVQIFFPDPWPKKRHHKRRIIQPDFIALLAKCVRPGGFLHLATDWTDYASHMQEVLAGDAHWLAISSQASGLSRIAARPRTRFEQRGLGLGYAVQDFVYMRRSIYRTEAG